MPITTLVILDEVNCKFNDLDVVTRRKLVDELKYYVPYAKHLPAVKLGRWDGSMSYCDLAGRTYVNLLDRLLPIVQQQGYDIVIEDQRKPHKFDFEPITNSSYSHITWPKGHPLAGQPIVVKDHQVEVVNTYLENLTGINIAPTGSGKCLDANTLLHVHVSLDTEFGQWFHKTHHYSTVDGIAIGLLANSVQDFRGEELEDEREVDVSEYGITVPTPHGTVPVNYVIQKRRLPMVYIAFSNGYTLRCAQKHILRMDNRDIMAQHLKIGDTVAHRAGAVTVTSIFNAGYDTCYDIGIPAPHLYYDANGLVHHNTIITAILSHKVEPYGRSIVIVPTKDLVTQTEEDYINFGLDVGVFYGDRKEYGKTHTICTWQSIESLSKKTKAGQDLEIDINDFFDGVVCVITDETHKARGNILRNILSGPLANAPIRWGLTGTMPEMEMEQVAVVSCIGPVLDRVETGKLQEAGILAKLHINVWQLQDLGAGAFTNYQSELKWLTSSLPRLTFLAEQFTQLAETGNTLILVDRIETGETLRDLIPDSIFVSGQMKSEDRKAEYKEVQEVNGKVIIATYGVASTGININRIFNLVLFEAGKSFVRVIQSIGRGIRVAQDKDFVNVYDVCSVSKYSRQHLAKRKKFYNDAQYPFNVRKISY